MEGVVPGIRGGVDQYIEDMGMKIHKAKKLARNGEYFQRVMMRMMFCKGPAHDDDDF